MRPLKVNEENSTLISLNAGATFIGTAENAEEYSAITCAVKTDQAGTLYMELSPDGTNWDESNTFSISAGTNEVHRIAVTRKYFRTRFTNTSGSNQTYLRLQTVFGHSPPLNKPLTDALAEDDAVSVTKAISYGQTDNGSFAATSITDEGHQEVALHDPLLPFGSVHTESLTPIFQSDAVYGVNAQQEDTFTSLSGTVVASDSSFVCSTGTTIYAQAVLNSRKRMRYRPGQGVVGRFTALYTSPVANSYQVSGFGHAEDGFYFGYKDLNFGILYVNRGVREARTLTVTTASSTNENITITLNGVAFSVAVTNSANIQRTAYEISRGTYAGWTTDVVGATVRFLSSSAGVKTGAYTLSGTTAVGTFAQTKAGVASTDTFIPQSSWNSDKLDGTGASGLTIDPTKFNVYQIGIQYLGAGTVQFKVMLCPIGSNNPTWYTVHVIKNPNTLTTTHIGNPSFPFTTAAYSAGSTTNLSIKNGSFAGFIEGYKYHHGPRFSYFNQLTTVGSTNYQALFTVMNSRYFAGRANQTVINIISASGALKHTSPCIFYLLRNATLNGNPNFSQYASNSAALFDNTATTVNVTSNDQIIWSSHLGDTGEFDHHFNGGGSEELTIQPGEWYTLAAKSTTGTPSYVTGSINTREDQ
jgi:hypothetical protein